MQLVDKYLDKSVKIVESVLAKYGNKLPNKHIMPMSSKYHLGTNATANLGRE